MRLINHPLSPPVFSLITTMSLPIPQPAAIPFLGNIANIEKEVPLHSFNLLAHQYGPIYKLNILGRKIVVLSTYELNSEISDEKRFMKRPNGGLLEVRNLVHDGLFTADTTDKNWGIAHRVLMPAFGTASVVGMFDDMFDIITQLIQKWDRFGPDHIINPAEDFTRLTLDAIALCSMSYRMNSFYLPTPHPFAQAMFDFLVESSYRSNRPGLVQAFMKHSQAKYDEDIKSMTELATSIVNKRKEHPTDKKDLLNLMLNGKDPKTGEGMTDRSIVDNLITFLIAGHETTSGMLTFAVYHLMKNPDALAKLHAEIDEVLGDQPIQLTDISKMPYTIAVMRETLRLNPTAPLRSVSPIKPTTLSGGKYAVSPDDTLVTDTHLMHRDPAVWGPDAEEFNPDRMLHGKFEALPPNAWQPFGFGMRGCIGRPFAWQEAHMTIATVYQKFDLVGVDPSYTLELKQSLTVKPANFYIRAIPRSKSPRLYTSPSSNLFGSRGASVPKPSVAHKVNTSNQPLYVLYGSNTGNSEAFAQRIATDAINYGFKSTMGTLDSAAKHFPNDGPVVIVTASFEGEPADNAAYFVKWLSNLSGDEFAKVKYAVFGCGNTDWVQSYQRIPKLVDTLIGERGGKRLAERGEGDASGPDMLRVFDEWEASLFATLTEEYQTTESIPGAMINIANVDTGTARAITLRQNDASLGEVLVNKVLTTPGQSVKRHIEFKLPEDQTYRAGDYLAILPVNPPRDVNRVLSHFRLYGEQEVSISSHGPTALPVDRPIALSVLLGGYVEISQPATPRNIRTLLQAENSENSTSVLQKLESSYVDEVLSKRLSILDILEANPDIKISFGTYLEILPAMRIRQYSISSSPLWNPQHVTLTISVLRAPAISGKEEPFMGVASNYLDNLKPGDRVQMAIRQSVAFHLPADPATPVVMFCAGSGIAPMRGFIQERVLQKQGGRDVGKLLLFFGCRSPKDDYLYSDTDITEWTKSGVLDVRPAFSRYSDESFGCKYVQDRIWKDRADITQMFKDQAKFYVCGSGRVASGIKQKLVNIISENDNCDEGEAAAKMELIIKSSRFATDVFE